MWVFSFYPQVQFFWIWLVDLAFFCLPHLWIFMWVVLEFEKDCIFMIRRQMGHFQWCLWWKLGRWIWWCWWMRAEGSLEASRYVLCALAVVELKGFAWPLPVAMPSIATFQTDPLASVHSHPRPVIALDAIFNNPSLPYYDYNNWNWGLSLNNYYVASVNEKWGIWEYLFLNCLFSN